MIRVTIELLSAITGNTTQVAQMLISNDGEESVINPNFGSYHVEILRGRSKEDFQKRTVLRDTKIKHWPRKAKHVWNLVATALSDMGYGK